MSASQLSTPAHWASWADAMPVLQRQLPSVAATILQALNNLDEAQPCIQAAQAAHQHIHAHGWEPQVGNKCSNNSRPKPKQKLSQGQPNQAGNTTRQPLSTEQPGQGYTTASMQPAKPCSIPKPDLLPAGLSPQFHIPQTRRILTTFFAFSCSAAFGFHYPLPNELVGAVAILTHLATTERPVPGRGCCEAEGYHWNRQLRGCAGKPVHVSPCTQDSATSTSLLCNASMTAPSRSSQMDSLCGTVPNSQSTLPLFRHSQAMHNHVGEGANMPAQPSTQHGATKNGHTPSWLEQADAAWWY